MFVVIFQVKPTHACAVKHDVQHDLKSVCGKDARSVPANAMLPNNTISSQSNESMI